ncbi:hypothetical protein CEXT_158141 [Caerostris extrusa]|uniref:Uncharacterized protein n=1 Tax=Caerostris extrusa TaxID=172846 RepID=A0AAV4XEJ6_CAEEX|nr:hypothetical protein CEXT_158141 [Caerostris extrusa]
MLTLRPTQPGGPGLHSSVHTFVCLCVNSKISLLVKNQSIECKFTAENSQWKQDGCRKKCNFAQLQRKATFFSRHQLLRSIFFLYDDEERRHKNPEREHSVSTSNAEFHKTKKTTAVTYTKKI